MTPALHPTYLVSFPRSGQHLVIRGLMWVMPDLVVYSENYKVNHRFDNCPAVNVQKEHDFQLALETKPECRYVVLTRQFEPAIKSWWRMTVGNGTPDSEQNFKDFLVGKKEYWTAFQNKWVIPDHPTGKTIKFYFDTLVAQPSRCLRRIAKLVLREIPTELFYENQRREAYDSFEAACRDWVARAPRPFKHQQILSEYLEGVPTP